MFTFSRKCYNDIVLCLVPLLYVYNLSNFSFKHLCNLWNKDLMNILWRLNSVGWAERESLKRFFSIIGRSNVNSWHITVAGHKCWLKLTKLLKTWNDVLQNYRDSWSHHYFPIVIWREIPFERNPRVNLQNCLYVWTLIRRCFDKHLSC